MINTNPLPAADRRARSALWAIARACLRTLNALFGGPGDVAAAGWLPARTRKLLRAWLNAAHAVIARLLLIEAAALPAPAPTAPRRRKPRARRTIEHHAHAPERWRVALRLLPRQRRSRRAPITTAAPRDRLDAWPLAERYEALLRACANPAPYARRLARRLHAAPRRAADIAAAPAPNAAFVTPDARATLTRAAALAAARFAARAPPSLAPRKARGRVSATCPPKPEGRRRKPTGGGQC